MKMIEIRGKKADGLIAAVDVPITDQELQNAHDPFDLIARAFREALHEAEDAGMDPRTILLRTVDYDPSHSQRNVPEPDLNGHLENVHVTRIMHTLIQAAGGKIVVHMGDMMQIGNPVHVHHDRERKQMIYTIGNH